MVKGQPFYFLKKFLDWKKSFANLEGLLLGFSALGDFLKRNNFRHFFFINRVSSSCCFEYFWRCKFEYVFHNSVPSHNQNFLFILNLERGADLDRSRLVEIIKRLRLLVPNIRNEQFPLDLKGSLFLL